MFVSFPVSWIYSQHLYLMMLDQPDAHWCDSFLIVGSTVFKFDFLAPIAGSREIGAHDLMHLIFKPHKVLDSRAKEP